MARLRLKTDIPDVWLEEGTVIETTGPVSSEMQGWLIDGFAELLDAPVDDPPPPKDAA